MCSFRKATRKGKAKRSQRAGGTGSESEDGPKGTRKKRKRATVIPEDDEDGDDEDDGFSISDQDEGGGSGQGVIKESDEEIDEWAYSFRPTLPPSKKPRRSEMSRGTSSGKFILEGDVEVMVLSSD